MPAANHPRAPRSGLHPSHFAALRREILRTGALLSDDQLLDLADGLHSQIRLRRAGRPVQRPEAWLNDEPRAFA
ncbi:MAG: hypothetical protein ACXW3O_02360 [Brevundimonas sp.]